MTDEVWYHALEFLDKYSHDYDNTDREELFKFADETGVLDKHKVRMQQPFNQKDVELKVGHNILFYYSTILII